MARSSGGGSLSGGRSGGGGSRSRSSSNRSSNSSGRVVRNSPFPGSRKFRYYRNGTTHYVYSNVDLTRVPDARPRWFLLIFYIPFIFLILSAFSEIITLPKKPLKEESSAVVSVIDSGNVFAESEEQKLQTTLTEFKQSTGIVAQIVTVDYEDWSSSGLLETYAYYQYYSQFADENGWLLVYSEQDDGRGDWQWEGVQGDNTIEVMDVFLDDFNDKLQSSLVANDVPDVAEAFNGAFNLAIEKFDNQTIGFNSVMLFPSLFVMSFVCLHAYLMIFAGTNKEYSNKELQEIIESETINKNTEHNKGGIQSCPFCGNSYTSTIGNRCPHCNAYLNY